MIYTITLNPALDRTLFLDDLKYEDANRVKKEERFAGGKGIDVSRVLTHLSVPNKALVFLGGYVGMEIEGLLLNEGIHTEAVKLSEETRTNIILDLEKNKQQVIINAKGPEVKPQELSAFFERINDLEDPWMVTFNGSLPPNTNPAFYTRAIELVKQKGALVFLDSDSKNLEEGIKGKPDFIKPNIHELSRLCGKELKKLPEIIAAAKDIVHKGVKTVIVSMGAKGITYVSEEEIITVMPPKVNVVNTIGAGDSSIAGFIYAKYNKMTNEEAVKYAVAAGTATTLQEGTALASKEEIRSILNDVKSNKL